MSEADTSHENADDRLQDILGWTKYESAAYRCLVAEGPLEAREVVVRTDVQQGRIYDVLEDLQNKGVVTYQEDNPSVYDANNPETLIQERKDDFNEKATELMETLGTAYELNLRERTSTGPSAWILGGRAGTVRKIREMIDDAEESILILDEDPRWYKTRDFHALQRRIDDGVEVKPVIWNARQGSIEKFQSYNLDVWTIDSVPQSIYIVDDKHVVFQIDDGDTGIILTDSSTASVFKRDFEASFNEAELAEDA